MLKSNYRVLLIMRNDEIKHAFNGIKLVKVLEINNNGEVYL